MTESIIVAVITGSLALAGTVISVLASSHKTGQDLKAKQSVTDEKMREYKRAGIKRISMGAQSLSDRVLGEIGRAHTLAQLESAIENVKNAAFRNFNVDLISALPGQSVEMWEETLNKAVLYGPAHISCYSLTVDPETPVKFLKKTALCSTRFQTAQKAALSADTI